MAQPRDPIWVELVIPVLTAVCGALTAFVVAQYQSSRTSRKELLAKQAAVQFAYLDPLRMAAESLAWKFFNIEQKIRENKPESGGLEWMLRMFHYVKEPREYLNRELSFTDYSAWCNGEGFFAVSTIYAAAVYLLHARRARRECVKDIELMRNLEAVRHALGHEYGIYVMLQDSMGEYVADEKGMEIGYRQFCTRLFHEEERLWFLNLMDYFRDISKKTAEQRGAIMLSLHNLLAYLGQTTGIQADDPLAQGAGAQLQLPLRLSQATS